MMSIDRIGLVAGRAFAAAVCVVMSVGVSPAIADDPKPTGTTPPASPADGTTSDKKAPALAGDGTTKEGAAKDDGEAQKEKLVYVTMKTSKGEILLELNREKAPISVENFLKYVEKGHYNGTIFHRVISNFMIQGGGFDKDMNQKPTDKPIKNEWQNGLKNVRGAIAMARTRVADSATSQFFINVVDNSFLDQPNDGAAYAVFGKVVAGMDVVDAIRAVKTGEDRRTGMGDVPLETVLIESATKTSAEDAKKAIDARAGKP